jgi:uncharacterized membrane protein
MIQWLRRRFIAGFFVIVPLVVSVFALIWIFGIIDGWTAPLYERLLRRSVPGLGIITTGVAILVMGVVATNVFGRQLLQRAEGYLLRVPVFRTVYAPVKQLTLAFSPDNEYGFKRVVLVRNAARGLVLGFLTKEFSLDLPLGSDPLIAVYVPTNHLYLGDIMLCSPDEVIFPDLSVEEGIRVFLTGGMALPGHLRAHDRIEHLELRTRKSEEFRSVRIWWRS